MKNLTEFKQPLAIFYQKEVKEVGFVPVDIATAKKKFSYLIQQIPEERLRLRIKAVCKYFNDIRDNFYKYRSNVIPVEIFTDRDVIQFIKEKAKRTSLEYQVKYNPALLTWAIGVVKSKNLEEVENKVKESNYEEVKGTILKAYEALELEGDYFLRQVLDLKS